MLCKVHPELYIPPLTQPIRNAPNLYHFTRLGVLCCADLRLSSQGWLSVRLIYSGGVILVVWSHDGLVWKFGGFGLGSDLMDCSGGLISWSNLDVFLSQIVWLNSGKLKR